MESTSENTRGYEETRTQLHPNVDLGQMTMDNDFARAPTPPAEETEDMKIVRMMNILQTLAINDSTFTPSQFQGDEKDTEKTERWLEYFNNYTSFRGIDDTAKLRLFKLLLSGQAAEWLRSLPDQITTQLPLLTTAFRQRFSLTDITRWQKATSMWTREQGSSESVDAYITDIINMARVVPITDKELIRFAIVKGLKNNIKIHVLQSGAATVEEVTRTARVAEAAQTASNTRETDVSALASQMAEILKMMKSNATATISTVETPKSTRPPSPSPTPRRVQFDDNRQDDRPPTTRTSGPQQREPAWSTKAAMSSSWESPPRHAWRAGMDRTPARHHNLHLQQGQNNSHDNVCTRCGLYHSQDRCKAINCCCYKCGQPGHYSRMCLSYDTPIPQYRPQYGGNKRY